MADFPDHSGALAALVGQSSGPIELSPDPVNTAMIRHWVEAMGDTNPVYTNHDAAVAAGYPGLDHARPQAHLGLRSRPRRWERPQG